LIFSFSCNQLLAFVRHWQYYIHALYKCHVNTYTFMKDEVKNKLAFWHPMNSMKEKKGIQTH